MLRAILLLERAGVISALTSDGTVVELGQADVAQMMTAFDKILAAGGLVGDETYECGFELKFSNGTKARLRRRVFDPEGAAAIAAHDDAVPLPEFVMTVLDLGLRLAIEKTEVMRMLKEENKCPRKTAKGHSVLQWEEFLAGNWVDPDDPDAEARGPRRPMSGEGDGTPPDVSKGTPEFTMRGGSGTPNAAPQMPTYESLNFEELKKELEEVRGIELDGQLSKVRIREALIADDARAHGDGAGAGAGE